ncbi:MAG: caspase family protein [Cyanobacteria bacterium P01_F01_bin.143]
MLRLKLLSVINVITLSLAFVLPAKEAHTVTISDSQLSDRQEVLKKELLHQLKQQSEIKNPNQLVAQRQERIALVIGNADYQEDPLANPVNDANDVAQALRELGFKVTLLNNLNWQEMDEAIENFSKQLKSGSVGLFYYAGHGVQVNGENYLIPLDAQLKRERDTRRETVPLRDVLKFMEEAESEVNIVIIDACRENPFYRQWNLNPKRGSNPVRGLSDSEEEVQDPPEGTIIAFATAPGAFAEDGVGQRNSPFTANLLKHIKTPNLEIARIFRNVRQATLRETDFFQRPWYRESLIGSFFFKTETPPVTEPTPPTITPSEPKPILISQTTGVDYSRLSNLLAERKWKEADRETTDRMLQAAGREQEGWLRNEELNKFFCEDLRIIDRLWLDSSQGKFGFSVQKKIAQNNGISTTTDSDDYRKNWRQFYIDIGWKIEESGIESEEGYVRYESLRGFTDILMSERGNLPAKVFWNSPNMLDIFGWQGIFLAERCLL